jgi:hypothetical protein
LQVTPGWHTVWLGLDGSLFRENAAAKVGL